MDKLCLKKGSTYLIVVLIVAILGLVGTAGFTVAYTNITLNNMFFGSNVLYYHAEKALAQVKVVFEKAAREARNSAIEYSKKPEVRNEIIAQCREEYDPVTDSWGIDWTKVEQMTLDAVKSSFNSYLLQDKGRQDLEDSLKGIETSINSKYESANVGVSLIYEIPSYEDVNVGTKNLDVTVKAISTNQGRSKTILAKYRLEKEPKEFSIKKVINKELNPIWTRAITTEENLIATGGEVVALAAPENILQNDNKLLMQQTVYAFGKNSALVGDNSNEIGDKYGGIIAGISQSQIENLSLSNVESGNGKMKIRGRTVTGSYIHVGERDSSIDIEVYPDENTTDFETINNSPNGSKYLSGFVYADSLQIEEGADNSSITINGDLVTDDDVELHSSNSTIDIKGNFFGVKSGPMDDSDPGNYANQSSSLIYNDKLGTSTLKIGKCIFVGGVAYNNQVYHTPDTREKYKTGESIGLGDNHRVYGYSFSEYDYANRVETDSVFDDNYYLMLNETPNPPPNLSPDPNYYLFSGKTSEEHNRVGWNRIYRYIDYIINYYKNMDYTLVYKPDLGYNEITGNNKINIGYIANKVQGFSQGVIPSAGILYSPRFNPDTNQYQGIQDDTVLRNKIKLFEAIDSIKFKSYIQQNYQNNYYKSTYLKSSNAQKDNNNNYIKKRQLEFDDLAYTNSYQINLNLPVDKTTTDTRLIAKTDGTDLEINFQDLDGKNGIVFSSGNLIISGEIDSTFQGALVARGNIIFKGGGKKTIIYNEIAVRDAIRMDSSMSAYLLKGGVSTISTGGMEIVLKTDKNVSTLEYRELASQ